MMVMMVTVMVMMMDHHNGDDDDDGHGDGHNCGDVDGVVMAVMAMAFSTVKR